MENERGLLETFALDKCGVEKNDLDFKKNLKIKSDEELRAFIVHRLNVCDTAINTSSVERDELEKLAAFACKPVVYYELQDNLETTSDDALIALIIGKLEVYDYSEDPVSCEKCGARTNFIDLENKSQLHECVNCNNVFIAVYDGD